MIQRLRTAERLFSRGQRYAVQQRFDEACQAFERAVSLQPDRAGFLFHWARALADTGRLPEAHAAMLRAMQVQPTNPVLPLCLAQMYFDHADYAAMHVWSEQAARLNPENPHVVALQALSALATGEVEQGYQLFQQPLALDPHCLEARILRAAKRPIPSVLSQCSASMQSRVLWVAEAYLMQHPAQARSLFQQLAACPDREMSSASYRVMVALDRVCTRVCMGSQRLYIRLRYANHEERSQRLQWVAAAEAYYLGDTATALSHYTALLAQLPEHEGLNDRLFELYYEHGDASRALQYLRRLIGPTQEPTAWQALCLGELLYQTGQWSEAALYVERAATLHLRDYKVPYYQGLCSMHGASAGQVRQYFTQAVRRLNPGLCAMRLEEVYRVSCTAGHPKASCRSADKI
jgi:tetratricopeptide (TPR) repeat protein